MAGIVVEVRAQRVERAVQRRDRSGCRSPAMRDGHLPNCRRDDYRDRNETGDGPCLGSAIIHKSLTNRNRVTGRLCACVLACQLHQQLLNARQHAIRRSALDVEFQHTGGRELRSPL